jgi:type II secretory pathway component PulF
MNDYETSAAVSELVLRRIRTEFAKGTPVSETLKLVQAMFNAQLSADLRVAECSDTLKRGNNST